MRKRCSIFEQSWNGKPWQPTSSQTAEITKSTGADDKDLPRTEQGCIICSILPSGMRARQSKNAPLEPSWVTSWVFDQFGENPHWTVTNLKPTKQRRDQNHHHVKENRVKKGAEYWKREIDCSLAKKNCIEDETNSGTTTPSLSSSWCLPIWSPSPPCEYLTGV